MCAACLHNFCSDERQDNEGEVAVPGDDVLVEVLPPSNETIPRNSLMRDMLVQQVYHSGLSQPHSNVRINGEN